MATRNGKPRPPRNLGNSHRGTRIRSVSPSKTLERYSDRDRQIFVEMQVVGVVPPPRSKKQLPPLENTKPTKTSHLISEASHMARETRGEAAAIRGAHIQKMERKPPQNHAATR